MAIVRRVRRREMLAGYRDSLKKEHRLEVDSAAASALQRVMAAFWDSVMAGPGQPGMRPNPTRPPLWRLDAKARNRRLLRLDGRGVTAGAFIEGLAAVPSGVWPSATKLDAFQRQVEFRALIDLRIAEARRLGLERQGEYLAGTRYDEEQILREGMRQKLTGELPVTEQELRDYYDLNKEVRYRQYERIRLSYLTFPKESEAREWLSLARAQDYIWWQSELKRLQTERPEVRTVAATREIDLSQPLPPEEKPLVDAATTLRAGDILDAPIHLAEGWAAVRVLDREREGHLPFERVASSIRTAVLSRKIDERIQDLAGEGRTRHRLMLYPERL